MSAFPREPAWLDRRALRFRPLAERKNKVSFPRDAVSPDAEPRPLPPAGEALLDETAGRIRAARAAGRPVMLTMGAHAIKNGLGPVLISLIGDGWLTHLATNGAGIIHDWELAYQGATSEDVRVNVALGEFGAWEETGRFLNLGLLIGAYRGFGYGASIGALIEDEGLDIPSRPELEAAARDFARDADRAAAAVDLVSALEQFSIPSGPMRILHPGKAWSVQAAAHRLGVPFTGHPMIGHDIIYEHPLASGSAIGRTAMRDFLCYAEGAGRLSGGVYLSVGSAVMSPMIFEKALSMARNIARQRGETIEGHFMLVVDLAASTWDWSGGAEPPADNPAYYLRYCKSFSRMGGTLRYLSADNRDFLLALRRRLRG
ncbi:MAG: hypothetical protein NTU62_18365 [Spirochaetes bacterium]|nr:hypothetical protein [Spirochaetota bacterium]